MTGLRSGWEWMLLLSLVTSTIAFAQEAVDPDALLPSATSIYFRWHGAQEYKEAWEKSHAYQGIVRSGLADFAHAVLKPDNIKQLLASSELPEEWADGTATLVQTLLPHVAEHGIVIGADVRLLAGEVAIILPNAVGTTSAGTIDSLVRKWAESQSLQVQEKTIFSRAVATLKVETFFLSWWNEGKHLVVVVNQLGPNQAVGRAAGKSAGYSKSPRYATFKQKRDYAVVEELWVDIEPLLKLLPSAIPEIPKMIELVGAKSLKGFSVATGFEGQMLRTDWALLMAEQRTGILSLLGGPALNLATVPKLPADADFAYVTTVDWMKLYDQFLAAVTEMAEIYPDLGLETTKATVEAYEEQLGYKFRDEILASLGDKMVLYSTPTDGPFFTGVSLAVAVKDRALLTGAIDRLVDLVGLVDPKFKLEKTDRDGRTYWVMGYEDSFFPLAPTLVMGKDYLLLTAVSPAAGNRFFDLQASTESAESVWKDISTQGVPGTVSGMIYSNPKRTIEFLASFVPMVAVLARQIDSDLEIDLTRAPRADIIVDSVRPGHAVTSFDGAGIYCTSRYSLPLTNPELTLGIAGAFLGGLVVGPLGGDQAPFVEDLGLDQENNPPEEDATKGKDDQIEEPDENEDDDGDRPAGDEPKQDDMTSRSGLLRSLGSVSLLRP